MTGTRSTLRVDVMKPWTKALIVMLRDGLWHHEDDIIPRVAAAVPPARAVRRMKDVGNGQRAEVIISIKTLVLRGRVEVSGDLMRLTASGMRATKETENRASTGLVTAGETLQPRLVRRKPAPLPDRLKPWAAAILDELADGSWRSRDAVLEAARLCVPDGLARESFLQDRVRPGKRMTAPDVSDARMIAIGGRIRANRTLLGMVKDRAVERQHDTLRMNPEVRKTWREPR